MVSPKALLLSLVILSSNAAQKILSDPGTYGPQLEIVHLYQDEWPTGKTVR